MNATYWELYYGDNYIGQFDRRMDAIFEANALRVNGRPGEVYRWTWQRKSRQWVCRQEAF